MKATTKPRPIRPARQFAVRLAILAGLLIAAALFGSLIEVSCQRSPASVDCQVVRAFEVPFTGGLAVSLTTEEVNGVRDVRLERQSDTRSLAEHSQARPDPRDMLLLIGDQTLEVGWVGARAPVSSFLGSPSRQQMTASQPADPRGTLMVWVLLAAAGLVATDSLLVLAIGNARINRWLGPRPDPDEPLPTTGLAKIGPPLLLAATGGVILFFAFGYRFVGPFAEQKIEALHQAAKAGDLTALDQAINSGVSVHAIDSASGRTALHFAAGAEQLIDRLLEVGADPNTFDLSGRTPLHTTASRGTLDAVEALLGAGADPNSVDNSGWTPLRRAAERGDKTVITALLEAGADPTFQGPHGWTALLTAAAGQHEEIVRVLLAAGAEPRVRNENGHRAIDFCCRDQLAEVSTEAP